MTSPAEPRAAELRVYLMVDDLQPQFAAYLGTPTRAQREITEVLTAVAGRDQ